MDFFKDLQTVYEIIKPKKNTSPAMYLESFYKNQAHNYDHFRKKLLPGREALFEKISEMGLQGNWADFGAGTGSNLELVDLERFEDIYLVDLSPSLLKQATQRVARLQKKNVHILQEDVCHFAIDKKFDLITFSYSLTMIPNWFTAIDNAIVHLKPNGILAVVDFYIPGAPTHSIIKKHFWPAWFSWDQVFLSKDHVPYLKQHLKMLDIFEDHHQLPYIPLSQVPYYHFIGQKKSAD